MSTDLSWLHGLFSDVWAIFVMVFLLSGSIFIHELGHFLAARWRGLKVERFSIGFGPKLWSWKGRDGVDYCISCIPLGGYVRLPQLSDVRGIEGESSDDAESLPTVKYRDKMIVVTAGVVCNLILAMALACLLWWVGVPAPAALDSTIIGYVAPNLDDSKTDSPALAAGLQPGDRILALDGVPVRDFRQIRQAIVLGAGRDEAGHPLLTVSYQRDGATHEAKVLPVLEQTNSRSGDSMREIGIAPAEEMILDNVEDKSPAQAAGLQAGDELLTFNGRQLYSPSQIIDLLADNGSTPVTISYRRNGETRDVTVKPESVPLTTPLASVEFTDPTHIVGGKIPAVKLDVLPIYALDSKADPASPATVARNLLVWNIEGDAGLLRGLHPNDFLLKMNGREIASVQQLVDGLNAMPKGDAPSLTYLSQSDNVTATTTLPSQFDAKVTPPIQSTKIGIAFKEKTVSEHVPPLQQFGDAVNQTLTTLGSLLNPHSDVHVSMLSSPVGIGRVLTRLTIDDVRLALWFTLIINVNLAILNLLPIPVLDGGHMLMFTIARLRGRDLPASFILGTQGVFMVLILGVMCYVIFNDSLRWLGDHESDEQSSRLDLYYLDKLNFAPQPETPAAPSTNSTAK